MEALEVIRREREEMERQYAALRAENESLKRLIQSDEGRRTASEGMEKRKVSMGGEERRRDEDRNEDEEKYEEREYLSDNSSEEEEDDVVDEEMRPKMSAAGARRRRRGTSRDIEDEFYLDNGSSEENSPTSSDHRNLFDGDLDLSPAPRPPAQRRRSLSHLQNSGRPISASETAKKASTFAPPRPISALSVHTNPLELPSSQSDQLTSLPQLLWKGGILWKIPFNGRGLPERRLVMIKRVHRPTAKSKPVRILGPDLLFADTFTPRSSGVGYISFPPTVIWANPEKPDDLSNARELILGIGTHLVEGHQSPAFWKTQSRGTGLPHSPSPLSLFFIHIV
jgi:hypothetical protein